MFSGGSGLNESNTNHGDHEVAPDGLGNVSEGAPELDELVAIAAQRCRMDHRESVLLAEVAQSGICDTIHGLTTKQWLADRTQQGHKQAGDRIQASLAIHTHFPVLADALEAGLIGWQHVGVLHRAANIRNFRDLGELLPELIGLAQVAGFERWAKEVNGIARRLDQDGGYDPATDPSNNQFHLVPTIDGVVHISGQLVGELALTITKLINAETDRVLTRYRNDHETSDGDIPVPSRGQAAAEALAELIDRGSSVPDATGKLPEPEIVVVLTPDDNHDNGIGELTDDDGNHLSVEILRFIIAAGLIRPLEISGTGDPLRMGRTLRYANRHQRRALMVRDGGCIFPGCDRPSNWCDAHHVDHWDHNGPTNIQNLAQLCRHHHRVTHRPGWVMTRDPGSEPEEVRFRWRTPTGRLLESQRHHQRSHPAAA